MRSVALDLTPWVRGPFTGVGLSAMRTFLALRDIAPVEAVCRDRHRELRWLGVFERFIGSRREMYHGFEARLPRLGRSRVALTVHDVWTLRANPYQSASYQKRQAPRFAQAIARADRIFTPTAAVRDAVLAVRPDVPVAVIPWAPLLEARPPVQAERPYFLCVACLETRKNLPMLFTAMRAMTDIDLVLVGHPGFGADRVLAALEELRASGTRVVHHAKIAEEKLAALYAGATALVQPSLDEGFGMPVVEAMQMGTPVVLSEIPAFRETAADAAVYFTDAEELRARLDEIKKDAPSRERLAKLSRARATQFTWARTAELHLEQYAQMDQG